MKHNTPRIRPVIVKWNIKMRLVIVSLCTPDIVTASRELNVSASPIYQAVDHEGLRSPLRQQMSTIPHWIFALRPTYVLAL